jgi:hypothetical protein
MRTTSLFRSSVMTHHSLVIFYVRFILRKSIFLPIHCHDHDQKFNYRNKYGNLIAFTLVMRVKSILFSRKETVPKKQKHFCRRVISMRSVVQFHHQHRFKMFFFTEISSPVINQQHSSYNRFSTYPILSNSVPSHEREGNRVCRITMLA